jgi:hypothetical protein
MSLGEQIMQAPVAIKEFYFADYCDRNESTGFVTISSVTGKEMFDKFKQKLIKEAQILSELDHPNILRVLDIFEENNTAYMVMRYIEGESLKEKVQRTGKIGESKALNYIMQVASGLEHVHVRNILHLDIKPSNIMVDKNENCYLIDFGISKRYDKQNHEQTSSTPVAHSKGFAPIEQVLQVEMNRFMPQTDIYSLGATLFFLLTGKVPKDSALRNIDFENNHAFDDLEKSGIKLSPDIIPVLHKAMEFKYTDRYSSVSLFKKDLEEAGRKDGFYSTPAQPDNDEKTYVETDRGPVKEVNPKTAPVAKKTVKQPPVAGAKQKQKFGLFVDQDGKRLFRVELLGLFAFIVINLLYGAKQYYGYEEREEYNLSGMNRVLNHGLYGYIDESGNEIIPCQYIEARYFSDGMALVMDDSYTYCFINTYGETVIRDDGWCGGSVDFQDGYTVVSKNMDYGNTGTTTCYYGIMDKQGKLVIPYQAASYDTKWDSESSTTKFTLVIGNFTYTHEGNSTISNSDGILFEAYQTSDGTWTWKQLN